MFSAILLASMLISGYQETLYPEWKQTFEVDQMIYQEKSDFWEISIFDNKLFGRVVAMDGIIQLTEADEFIYHEMMSHVALLSHPNPKSVLIIGGGDGGLLREVLRHKNLDKIIQVEIDPTMIELSKKYLPNVSQGAFDNPRATIVIEDAAVYVQDTEEKFDVVICDTNDPKGPAAVLFSKEFYGNCKRVLNPGGILICQNGVPFMQKDEITTTRENRLPHFKHVEFFTAPVPTYVGGFMAFGWASDKRHRVSTKTLHDRLLKLDGKMKYYTPGIHKAAFALPQYMLDQ